MNVLVTGANGQLGQTIQEYFKNNSYGIKFYFTSKGNVNITDRKSVHSVFKKTSFDYCINCAAYTNVDAAEDYQEEAYKINSEAVSILAKACKSYNVVLIHVSTDYVFNGSTNTPYHEESKTNPINVYGASKLAGEKEIQELLSDYFIIRTSWLYSPFGNNFVKTIIEKIKRNKDLTIITSQTGTPTSCIDLAEFIITLIYTKNRNYGIYHYSAIGETTWYGFAQRVAKHYDNYSSSKLTPIESYPTKALRPIYSVLSTAKASSVARIHYWEKSVDRVVETLKSSD